MRLGLGARLEEPLRLRPLELLVVRRGPTHSPACRGEGAGAPAGVRVQGVRSRRAVRGRSRVSRSTAGRQTRRASDRPRPSAATTDHAPPPRNGVRAPGAAAGAPIEPRRPAAPRGCATTPDGPRRSRSSRVVSRFANPSLGRRAGWSRFAGLYATLSSRAGQATAGQSGHEHCRLAAVIYVPRDATRRRTRGAPRRPASAVVRPIETRASRIPKVNGWARSCHTRPTEPLSRPCPRRRARGVSRPAEGSRIRSYTGTRKRRRTRRSAGRARLSHTGGACSLQGRGHPGPRVYVSISDVRLRARWRFSGTVSDLPPGRDERLPWGCPGV